MKMWALIIVAISSFSALYSDQANPPEKIEALAAKVILQNTQGYFVLSDGSCWKVIGFCKRWRTLSEWWSNVQLAPENYECVPNDWFLGTQIEAYPKYDNLSVNQANASNQDALKQCTHLLLNNRTGQILFAIALHPTDCIIQLYSDAYEDGYNKGLHQGRLSSYQNATDIYNSGYSDGYKQGYTEGYQTALRGEEGHPGN